MTRWQCFPGSQQEPRGVKGSTGRRPCRLSTAGLSRDSAALWRPQGVMLCGFWKMMKRTPGVDVAQVGAPLGPADAVSEFSAGWSDSGLPKEEPAFLGRTRLGFVRRLLPSPTSLPPARVSGALQVLRPSLSLSPHILPLVCAPPFSVPWSPAPQ